MNAYELADLIGMCGDGGYNQDAATMLRQQADRIVELEVYEKQMQKIKTRRALLDFILDPEKENT
jgi:hypothetical protein